MEKEQEVQTLYLLCAGGEPFMAYLDEQLAREVFKVLSRNPTISLDEMVVGSDVAEGWRLFVIVTLEDEDLPAAVSGLAYSEREAGAKLRKMFFEDEMENEMFEHWYVKVEVEA